MSGFIFSSSSSSTHQFSPFCSTSSSSSSNSVFPSISPPSSGLFFGSFSSNPSSSSTSFAFGSPKFTSSSSTTTSNLFGSATLSSVSATSPAVFGSSSSNSISTGTSSAPFFSSNLFVSSSSSSPSFPNLFGSSSFPAISAPAFSFASSVSNAGSSSSSFSYTNTPASSHPGFSLSTETSAPASSGQPQSTAVAPLFGSPFPIDGSCSATFLEANLGDKEEADDGMEEVYTESGQGRDGLAKQVTVTMAEQEAVVTGLRTDQEEESQKVMKMEVSRVQASHENETNQSVVSISADSMSKLQPTEAIVDTPNASMAELNGGKEVQLAQDDAPICVEGEGKSGVASTVIAGDEASAHGTGSQTFCVSAPFIYVNGFCISSQNGVIVQQIFEKYGDITKGSKIKSVAAKSGFLELVADTVQRLCNHTMKSLGLDELQFIEQHTGDALAVGFNVNWLHQRVEKIISALDYHLHLMELDKLAKQIDDAKKSLMEMELRQMICMQEVAAIKGEMEENGFGESNLGEGLL
ncbi:hypothetical protein CsSME_00024283 [Camellia sinensis var. sinensis]